MSGIAVSGGVDSMALACLCNKMKRESAGDQLTLKAFVVDHKLRSDSSREATVTRSRLEELG